MLNTNAPKSQPLQRVCIRCGDANAMSVSRCMSCGFDLTSDLQRDYDFYRDGVPLDRPSGVGERQANAHAAQNIALPASDTGSPEAHKVPAQGTMDLGAEVLQAVCDPAPSQETGKARVYKAELLEIELGEEQIDDPVAWSPSKAIRVEPAVRIEGRRAPLGAIQDWSPPSPQDTISKGPAPLKVERPKREGGSSFADQVATVPERPSVEASRERLITEALPAREPLSRRNHIRKGATTYIDAVQSSVRRDETGWLHRDAALPFAIAVGLVSLLLFALM